MTPDVFTALHPRSEITLDTITKASRLRSLGLAYTAIAAVMGEYHGAYFQPGTWRHYLRGMGHPPTRAWNRCGAASHDREGVRDAA